MARMITKHAADGSCRHCDGPRCASLLPFAHLPDGAKFRHGLRKYLKIIVNINLQGNKKCASEQANAVDPADGALHLFAADCLVSWDGEFHFGAWEVGMGDRRTSDPVPRCLRGVPMVPFSEVRHGTVFVIEITAYLKLAADCSRVAPLANAVDLRTGRLCYVPSSSTVAWTGARS